MFATLWSSIAMTAIRSSVVRHLRGGAYAQIVGLALQALQQVAAGQDNDEQRHRDANEPVGPPKILVHTRSPRFAFFF
jgi:hypothetical protein